MKSECSLICFFLIDIWKKLCFVCYPWKLGGNAEQTCGVLHILFLEYHWAVQVGGIFLLSYQVCTEQSGCSQKLCKEDFDHCNFWKRVKAPWVMDCSQPSFTCQKLRQGWSLKVILPCFFLCCFESIVKWSLLSLKGSYFERFIRQPRQFIPVFRMTRALQTGQKLCDHHHPQGQCFEDPCVTWELCWALSGYTEDNSSSSFHVEVFVSPPTVGIPITCFPALELNGNHSPGSVTLSGSLSTP